MKKGNKENKIKEWYRKRKIKEGGWKLIIINGTDDNGLSDPYCVVHLAGTVVKTERQKETTFPQWYQALALDVQLPENLNLAPSISILVYDHDVFSAGTLSFLSFSLFSK